MTHLLVWQLFCILVGGVTLRGAVHRERGADGVIGLMSSRSRAQPGATDRDHLLIVLTRPGVLVGTSEADQIEGWPNAAATGPFP